MARDGSEASVYVMCHSVTNKDVSSEMQRRYFVGDSGKCMNIHCLGVVSLENNEYTVTRSKY